MATSPTAASTAVAAGVKTPGKGAYSDPMQVGAMIQKMYPQYANFDAATLGQRWIDVHTPAAPAAGSGDLGGAVLQAPGTTPMTSTNPNAPDLSGLNQFASPVQPQAPKIIISGLSGNGANGSQLTPMTTPAQYSPPQQPKPQGLSTFDINKLKF